MAKRTPRSEADDSAAVAQPPAKERRSRPRNTAAAETGIQAAPAKAPERPAAASDPAPAINTTQAARPRVEDVRPPEDTIAANPAVLEATNTGDTNEPTEDQIRERAYGLYLERGGEHGRHEDDWYRAAEELRQRK
jgi:Protein of unknown function (DUF2934)